MSYTFEENNYNNNNYNNNYNSYNYNGNNYNNSSNIVGTPVVKKKKHRFLKFILKLIIILAIVILTKKFADMMTEKAMQKFVSSYPFEFRDETNSLYYITDDFKVNTQYELNGKTYKVNWKSSKNNLSIADDGTVIVSRPSETSRNVELTEEYKSFIIGKAKRTFDATVIAEQSLKPEDIDVVTQEELENKTYNREMTAYLDENGNIESMYGDFGKLMINSKEDAQSVVIAYAKQFNIPDNISFKLCNYSVADDFGVYTFDIIVNNIEIENETIQLTVNNGKLVKITSNIDVDSINTDDVADLSNSTEIINQYLINEGRNTEYVTANERTVNYNDKLCKACDLYIENDGYYTIYIDIKTQEVIELKTTEKNAKEKVVCSGTTETGNKIKFDASKGGFLTDKYSLIDQTRNIAAVDNKAFWLCAKAARHMEDDNAVVKTASTIGTILLLGEQYIAPHVNLDITSDTTEFNYPIAVQAYKNIQDSYDWYVKTFNRYSYDNNGAEIKLLIDSDMQKDNACWCGPFKVFMINPTNHFKYSLGKDLEVLGHEFTHAVFGSYVTNDDNKNKELAGANEAYADVFGCLIANKWVVGNNYYDDKKMVIRDIEKYNTDLTNYDGNTYYPEKYKDEYWTGEEHNISVLISHVAYEMHASKLFSDKDVANIWYTSLTFGLNSDTTYVNIRRNLIEAADQLGFDTLHKDFIAYQFELEEIYDNSYEITSPEYLILGNEPETTDESTLKTESKAVDGDWMLDDETSRTYLVVMSPIGIMLEGKPFVVYETGSGISKSDIKERTAKLTEYANSENSVLKDLLWDDNTEIEVEYKVVNPMVMSMVKKLCEASDRYILESGAKYLRDTELDPDENKEIMQILKAIIKIGFYWYATDSTPYNLYDDLGFIN